MKEQSHKHEMAAAVRGDFARLRERGVAPTIGLRAPADVPARPPDAPRADDDTASALRRLFRRG